MYQYYMETDPGFAKSVESNGRRYAKLFAAAADELMPPPSIEDIEFDTMDEFLEQVGYCSSSLSTPFPSS